MEFVVTIVLLIICFQIHGLSTQLKEAHNFDTRFAKSDQDELVKLLTVNAKQFNEQIGYILNVVQDLRSNLGNREDERIGSLLIEARDCLKKIEGSLESVDGRLINMDLQLDNVSSCTSTLVDNIPGVIE